MGKKLLHFTLERQFMEDYNWFTTIMKSYKEAC